MQPLILLIFSLLPLLSGSVEAEIVFAGDAMMHKAQIEAAGRKDGIFDFSEYFSGISDYIADADYAVVNLETPTAGKPYSGYPCFNAPDGFVDALADVGFDLFLTANNHTLDRHDRGLIKTASLLDSLKLSHIGTYPTSQLRDSVMPFIKTIGGIPVAFLNYTYGTNGISPGPKVVVDYIDRGKIKKDIENAKAAGAELIFACVHWGTEYKMLPDASQRSLEKFLRDEGVDAIIGSHPHVVQPIVLDTSGESPKLTVYSLGNFISNMKTRDTRGGALVKVKIGRDSNGKAYITDTSYRLVFTEPAVPEHNYRLSWVDSSSDPRAAAFAREARRIYGIHNKGVSEDFPKMK